MFTSINDRFLPIKRFSMVLVIRDRIRYSQAMFTPAQCRAARGLLDWSQQKLAEAAGVGVVTVRQLEGGGSQPRKATLDVLRRALEAAGVEFIAKNGGGPGVRLKDGETDPKR